MGQLMKLKDKLRQGSLFLENEGIFRGSFKISISG